MDAPDQNSGNEPGAHQAPAQLDYEIVRRIGRGGYGEVWLVRDKQGEYRACKVVYRESFANDRPYLREYEGICKFEPVSRSSESQVKILYTGRRDEAGYFFYIMELADDVRAPETPFQPNLYQAKTLHSELQRRGRFPAAECVEIGAALALALENLHAHGLIHRDIKPANVIFVQGQPKLADIGLVTEADVTVSYVGTEGYIPPEGPSSPQSDVYALGKTLYEICTGQDRLEYPELPADFGTFPDREQLLELNAVIARACESDCRKRYRSARALFADLALLKSGRSVRRKRRMKGRSLAAAVLALACGLIGLGGFLLYKPQRPAISTNQMPGTLPSVRPLSEAEQRVRAAHRELLQNGRGPNRQVAADTLIAQARASSNPDEQMADLRVAALLETEAGNFTGAMQVCDHLADLFKISPLPDKLELLSRAPEINGKKMELAHCCARAGFQAITEDDFQLGPRFVSLAAKTAQYVDNRRLGEEADFLNREMIRCQAAYASIASWKKRFLENPSDPAAMIPRGSYLALVKNDWTTGLPLLAKSSDPHWRAAAFAELNDRPSTADGEAALGVLWEQLPQLPTLPGQASPLSRARYWYLKALAQDPQKFAGQAARWKQLVPTEPGEVHLLAKTVETTLAVNIYSDAIQLQASRGVEDLRINQFLIGDLKAGETRVYPNCGASWLLPADLDFSCARIIIDKKKKGSHAKAESFPDHVHLILSHTKGSGEFEISLAFNQKS